MFKLFNSTRRNADLADLRGNFTENIKFKKPIKAISIVDEYLEHARVIIFKNGGQQKVFISSADWMSRNLDYRLEVCCSITNTEIKNEILDIINIQLSDNCKARVLDNALQNKYVTNSLKPVRSQLKTYEYLFSKLHNKTGHVMPQ